MKWFVCLVLIVSVLLVSCSSDLESRLANLEEENQRLSSQVEDLQSTITNQEEQIQELNELLEEQDDSDVQEELLKICPEELIENLMPCSCTDEDCSNCNNRPIGYYILDGERRELTEFDNEWIEQNCDLEPTKVY